MSLDNDPAFEPQALADTERRKSNINNPAVETCSPQELDAIEAALNDGDTAPPSRRVENEVEVEQPVELTPADEPTIEALDARDAALEAQAVTGTNLDTDAKRGIDPKLLALVREKRHAIERDKVIAALDRIGLTEADLPADFWDKDREERDQILRELKDKQRAADAGRTIGTGLSWADQRRAQGAERVRRFRAKRKAAAPSIYMPLPSWKAARRAELDSWISANNPRKARQLSPSKIVEALAARHALREATGKERPTEGQMAKLLGCTSDAARNQLRQLRSLRDIGPDWA